MSPRPNKSSVINTTCKKKKLLPCQNVELLIVFVRDSLFIEGEDFKVSDNFIFATALHLVKHK